MIASNNPQTCMPDLIFTDGYTLWKGNRAITSVDLSLLNTTVSQYLQEENAVALHVAKVSQNSLDPHLTDWKTKGNKYTHAVCMLLAAMHSLRAAKWQKEEVKDSFSILQNLTKIPSLTPASSPLGLNCVGLIQQKKKKKSQFCSIDETTPPSL